MLNRSPAFAPMAFLLAGFAWSVPLTGFGAETTADPVAINLGASGKFTEIQRDYVHSWIREIVPECPREQGRAAADKFLEELQQRSPHELERLMSPDFPVRNYRAMLFRLVGAQLTDVTQAALREDVARRRIQAVLQTESGGKILNGTEAAELVAKIRTMASVYSRRLFEGRMDDDDLAVLMKKARESGAPGAVAVAVKPKILTAADIVSEFARRNQEGSAWQRLRAVTVHSRLTTSAGEEFQVSLSKMRPGLFRMAMLVDDATRLIVAFDGEKYWQQVRGQAPQAIPQKAVGLRRYLGEFADPLVGEEGFSYDRLDDGAVDGKKVFRLAVRRGDGSSYVALIDPETYHQLGRETEDKQTIRYSDFRVIAGVTMAFREESVDGQGRKNTLIVTRVDPNPGLIQAFFEPSAGGQPNHFQLEEMVRRQPLATTR